jgi:hypothetical protein
MLARLLFVLASTILCSGCAVLFAGNTDELPRAKNNPPSYRLFHEGTYWVLTEPMRYELGTSGEFIVVPRGFVTDFASIPQALHWIYRPTGRYSMAAVVHDYLYWRQPCEKRQADRILLLAMLQDGMSAQDAQAVYAGVNLPAADAAFEKNRLERLSKLPKIVDPRIGAVGWIEYRKLQTWAFEDATPLEISANFCVVDLHGRRLTGREKLIYGHTSKY